MSRAGYFSQETLLNWALLPALSHDMIERLLKVKKQQHSDCCYYTCLKCFLPKQIWLWFQIQNSDSWQKAFRDLQATFQQMQDQGIGNASAAGSEALNGMSRLVCGRGNSFLAIGTEQRSTQNSRTPVNPNLNTETTTGPPTELGGTSNCENMSLSEYLLFKIFL